MSLRDFADRRRAYLLNHPQIKKAAAALGGGGGGRDDVAQGGGAPLGDRGSAALDEAFSVVRAVVTDMAGHGGVA